MSTGKTDPKLDLIAGVISYNKLFLRSPVAPANIPDYIATTFPARYLCRNLDFSGDLRLKDISSEIKRFYLTGNDKKSLLDQENYINDLVTSASPSSPDGRIDISISVDIFGGAKSFGWFTSYAEGHEEAECWRPRPRWTERGDASRDVLGLVHYGNGPTSPYRWKPELLACYVIPRTAIPVGTRFFRPNALDAMDGKRFKARFGKVRAPTAEWGHTVDLSKFCGPRPHRGAREIVADSFVPTAPITCSILGTVWVPRLDFLDCLDDEFATAVVGKRRRESQLKIFGAL